MVASDLVEGIPILKGEWSCALEGTGVLCVMICGMLAKPRWFADNSASQNKVFKGLIVRLKAG